MNCCLLEPEACIKKYAAVAKGVEVYNSVGKRVKQEIPGEGFSSSHSL